MAEAKSKKSDDREPAGQRPHEVAHEEWADAYENRSSDGSNSTYKVEPPAEPGGHTNTVQERGEP
jgi:hypothetical protein